MIMRALDVNGDWRFGKGLSDYAADELAIELNIKTRLLSWIGDCFFALADGIDWKNRLDVGQRATLENEVRALIGQSYGVVAINSVQSIFDPKTRSIRITYDIQTIFSPSFQRAIQQAAGSPS